MNGGADLVRAGLSGLLHEATARAEDRSPRVQGVDSAGQARATRDANRAGLRHPRIPPYRGVTQNLTLSGNSCSATSA